MTTVWDLSLLSEANPIPSILFTVLIFGILGAVFGSMSGLAQWSLLRSRSSAAFPGRMILISTVAGAAGAIAQPLVNFGLLVFLVNVVRILPPQLSFIVAGVVSIAAMGVTYGAIMATAAPGLPSSGSGSESTSEFFGARPRLPRGW